MRRDDEDDKWDPFNPDDLPQEKPKEYPPNRFKFVINVRHKTPYAKPELVLTGFAPPLLAFLR
jgi:hypothetical protein